MSKPGRKRKAGKRTKSGQLSRAGVPRFDRGTPRVEAKFTRFGTNGADAIGRAYEAGLLGTGQEAKALLDTARAIFRAYWVWYTNGPIRCALSDSSGSAIRDDDLREKAQEKWLEAMLKVAGSKGIVMRRLFDELVIDHNPDFGPPWMDRLLSRSAKHTDVGLLDAAVALLAECSGINPADLKNAA